MPDTGEKLPRSHRLSAKRISKLFETGIVGKSKLLIVRILPNDLDYSRAAVIVSRKAGNAVKRNRIKRRLRAVFRKCRTEFHDGYDLVLIARFGVLEAQYPDLEKDFLKAAEKACGCSTKNSENTCSGNNAGH